MLHRRDLVDSFLAFARELQRHRAAIRGLPGPAGRPAEGGEAAEPLPSFFADDTLGLTMAGPGAAAAARQAGGLPGGIPGALPMSVPMQPDAEIVIRQLQDFLEAQAAQVARTATDLMINQYREAQYAMAALADDLFIHEVEWNGREIWRTSLLEHALFRTRLAGERVFDRMEALLASNDRRLSQLAAVYLLVLGLGFKGRYRTPGGDAQLRGISARLFEFIAGRDADLAAAMPTAERALFPQAYSHTLSEGPARALARGPRWPLVLAAVGALWLVAGQAAWWVSTTSLSNAAEAVLQASLRVTR